MENLLFLIDVVYSFESSVYVCYFMFLFNCCLCGLSVAVSLGFIYLILKANQLNAFIGVFIEG